MTHYLRNNDNDTVVDIETTKDDLDCVVSIKYFAKLLDQFDMRDNKFNNAMSDFIGRGLKEQVVDDFSQIQEIRSWYFESVEPTGTPDEFVGKILKYYAKKYEDKLFYLTD